ADAHVRRDVVAVLALPLAAPGALVALATGPLLPGGLADLFASLVVPPRVVAPIEVLGASVVEVHAADRAAVDVEEVRPVALAVVGPVAPGVRARIVEPVHVRRVGRLEEVRPG